MPTLIIDQETVYRPDGTLGLDTDGSRDGRFITGFQGDWSNNLVYWTIQDLRPGHVIHPTVQGPVPNKYAISVSWLRFHIPLAKDPNLVIDRAYLMLYWHPNLGRPHGHPDRDANVNKNITAWINIGLISNGPEVTQWGKGPIPASSPDGNTLRNFINIYGDSVDWNDSITCCEVAEDLSAVLSADFGDQIQSLYLESDNWEIDDPITLFMSINIDRPRVDMFREWRFRSWSWNATFNNGDQSTSPKLIIDYHYDTPTPDSFSKSFVHDLLLYHDWDEITLSECLESEIVFEEDWTVVHHHHRQIEHRLFFTHNYSSGFIERRTIEHLIPFEQDIEGHREFVPIVEHVIVFDHYFTTNQDIIHLLQFIQTVDVAHVRCRDVEHELLLDHEPDYSDINAKGIVHTLNLQQFFSYEAFDEAKRVSHTLTLQQEIGLNFSLNFDIEHQLSFIQSVVAIYLGEESSVTCNRPDIVYDPNKDSFPTISPSSTVELNFPTTSPTHTVQLSAPLHGDVEELQVTRIQRKSKGGDLIVYSSDDWPTYEIRKYSFTGLTDQKRSDLFAFMGASLGQLIRFRDHEGRTWDGILINPNGDFAQTYRQCGNTSEFWFQPISEVT